MEKLGLKKRVSEHEAFIMKNKVFFDTFFLPDNWKHATFGKINNEPGSIFLTKKIVKADLVLLGRILHDCFDYSPRTNGLDVVLHFKRVYNRLYEIPT